MIPLTNHHSIAGEQWGHYNLPRNINQFSATDHYFRGFGLQKEIYLENLGDDVCQHFRLKMRDKLVYNSKPPKRQKSQILVEEW